MHVCRMVIVEAIGGALPEGVSISDDNVAADQAAVRGLVVKRLEQLWATIEPHVDGRVVADGYRVDPRMIQAGITVVRELGKLYRLDRPAPAAPEAVTGAVTDRVAVERSLAELEARLAGPGPEGP